MIGLNYLLEFFGISVLGFLSSFVNVFEVDLGFLL